MIGIGIIGGADIAYRMFIPSLLENNNFRCIGVATNSYQKKDIFSRKFNISVFDSYDVMIENSDVKALYIPLPPELHYKWAKKAIEKGKHVFIEKPSTTSYQNSHELVNMAKEKNVVIHENYMFQYHSQLSKIMELIKNGRIGDIRLIKCSFGFPLREKSDFRYSKSLGGGALLDAGGYVTKLASIFLGDSIKVQSASKNMIEGFDVDMYGSVTFINERGLVCQAAYGMDCYYQCNLEVWGSHGKLSTNRIFTAPKDFTPKVLIDTAEGSEEIILHADNHFSKSIEMFYNAIKCSQLSEQLRNEIILQSKLIEDISNYNKGVC